MSEDINAGMPDRGETLDSTRGMVNETIPPNPTLTRKRSRTNDQNVALATRFKLQKQSSVVVNETIDVPDADILTNVETPFLKRSE